MKISVIPLVSQTGAVNATDTFLSNVKEKLKSCYSENPEEADFTIFAIVTGGTEQKFKEVFRKYGEPYILLYNEFNNSLPAAVEILAFLKEEGLKGELLDVNNLSCRFFEERFPLYGKVLGAVGKPSDWLIASTYPDSVYEKTFGIKIKHISIKEAEDAFFRADKNEARRLAESFAKKASKVYEVNLRSIEKAFLFYLALKEIIEKYSLDFVSVRCFDIIKPLGTTGCLALSELNSEGVTAGCEGDLPAAISMEIARIVSGKPAFMANVSYVSKSEGSLTVNFAHCTVATGIVKDFNLRTHFETGIGVGIEGRFEEGSVTVFRIVGRNADAAFVSKGYAKSAEFSPFRCRTQLNVEFPAGIKEYFLKDPLGNHHVIVPGDYESELKEFLKFAGIRFVKIP